MGEVYSALMANKLKIVELGDPILRKKAKAVSKSLIRTKKFQSFIDDLIRTCDKSAGVGIASPQVGVSQRLFILWSRAGKRYKNVPKLGPIAIINPKIIATSKKMVDGYEGCLSLPHIRGVVRRFESVDVSFTTREGENVRVTFEGFPARIFQHEFDHLNGVMFIDRVDIKTLITTKEYEKLVKKSFRK